MPVIQKTEHYAKSDTGEKINFKYTVHANSEGVFYLTIHDPEITERLLAIGVKMDRLPRVHGPRVTDITKDGAIRKLGDGVNELLKCETIEQDVIKYSYTTTCTHFVDADGVIWPNGEICEDGVWAETYKRGENCDQNFGGTDFTVGFYAYVAKKITYKSAGREENCYKYHPSDLIETDAATNLNRFCQIRRNDNDKELPYSDETAVLFYNAMLSLCEVSRKIQGFFESSDNILDAAKNNLKILGGGVE